MNDIVKLQLDDTAESMEKAVSFADNELTKIRAGKAMPSMLDGIYIDYYGSASPLSKVATINTPDARTLVIQPWEKNLLQTIEKALIDRSEEQKSELQSLMRTSNAVSCLIKNKSTNT